MIRTETMCPPRAYGLWKQIAASDHPSRLQLAFTALDMDGDGIIRSSDISSFFNFRLRQSFAQEEADAMIALADLDGNGGVDLQEFQHLMTEGIASSSAMMDRPESKAMRGMFQVLDMNKDGLLSVEDLKSAMDLAGEPVSDEELHTMIAAAGGSRRSPIDFDCFSSLMTSLHG